MRTIFTMLFMLNIFIGVFLLQPVVSVSADEISSETEQDLLSIMMSAISENKIQKNA